MKVNNKRAMQGQPGIVKPAILPVISSEGLDIPDTLQLVRHADGKPSISLSIVLERQPQTHETIGTLIVSGVLAFEVQLATQQESENKLFARQASYALHWEKEDPMQKLTEGLSSGTEARVALSANLNRAQAFDALAAFQKQPAWFNITANVQYREEGEPTRIRLSGSWAAIHQFVKQHCNESGQITESTLHSIIPSMIGNQLILVTDDQDLEITIPDDILIRLFMRQAAVIVKQTNHFGDEDITYVMRREPHAGFQLDYSESVKLSSLKCFDLKAPLHDLIAEAFGERNLDDHIFLVANVPDDPARVVPVARKIAVTPRSRRDVNDTMPQQLAAIGDTLYAVSLATRASVNTAIQIKTPLIQVLDVLALDNITLSLYDKNKPISLPVVADPKAPYWPDRLNPKKAWYAPELNVAFPQPNADPSTSPFLFSYETIGASSSGRPALKGTLRFSLEKKMSKETSQALAAQGIKDVQSVPLDALAIAVLIPFVDETDGQVKQHALSATILSNEEKITAEVQFLNDWVRLAYGALAVEGFQPLPVQVQIAFTFRCYVKFRKDDFDIVYGAKMLELPVLFNGSKSDIPNRSEYLDAATLTYVHPLSRLQFQQETPIQENKKAGAEGGPVNMKMAKSLHHAVTYSIRPQIVLDAVLLNAFIQADYAETRKANRNILPLLYPCNQYGSFYQEIKGNTALAIACQDALKLGEIKYRQFEEIPELHDDKYFQVYRSLSQPGHFILVPMRFCISRREAGEPDAYRPLIFLNAVVDAENPANNKVELRTTLQPDIPVFKRSQIMEKLKAFHPSPTVRYPTDIANNGVVFNWALDSAILANCQMDMTDPSGPFISTYFSMDLSNWQLLKSVLQSPGLNGSVVIKLADGTEFVSNLLMKLDHVHGPWINGPLELSAAKGKITITNQTEGTIDVSDLVRYAGSAIAHKIPVEVSLGAEQAHTVNGPDNLVAVYSYPVSDPVAIEEIRSFVEDIESNLIFINLVALSNHDLLRLDVEARVRGVEGIHKGKLTEEERVIEFDYILPLTAYLDSHVVDFRITKIFNSRAAELTDWMAWDLNRGPVSITSDLLSLKKS